MDIIIIIGCLLLLFVIYEMHWNKIEINKKENLIEPNIYCPKDKLVWEVKDLTKGICMPTMIKGSGTIQFETQQECNDYVRDNKIYKDNQLNIPNIDEMPRYATLPKPTEEGWIQTNPLVPKCLKVQRDKFLKYPPGYKIYSNYQDCMQNK